MSNEPAVVRCQICGEPMPPGEEVFKFHGYSGPCPKPPLPVPPVYWPDVPFACAELDRIFEACGDGSGKLDADWIMVSVTKALEALHEGSTVPVSPCCPAAKPKRGE